MANAFGRDSPWHGGTEPPPTTSNIPFETTTQAETECAPRKLNRHPPKEKNDQESVIRLRTHRVQKNSSLLSQSFKTFVSPKVKSFRPQNVMSPPTVNKAVNVTPDKPAGPKLSSIGTKPKPNRFFNAKRKKVDDEPTQWTKTKLIEEVSKLWNDDESKNDQQCFDLSEQELRKELYAMVTSSKKHKKKDEVTMDIGGLLVDSTMEYDPMLNENSSDADIECLVKHDAILELANFIQMCGKRANMYQLHEKPIQELHEQLKLARDEHKQVNQVFPELKGEDATWFGPKGERRDRDYEPTDEVDQDSDDWWDDLITDEELNTLTKEKEETVQTTDSIKKTSEETAYLQHQHDGLVKKLMNEASKSKVLNVAQPDTTHTWTKDKLASTIIPLGHKLGKTIYYSVLMNQTKTNLRAKLATLQSMLKEKSEKESKSMSKEKTEKANKENQIKKENKNNIKKENKKEQLDPAKEPGSDGEFEWTDGIITQPDTGHKKEVEQEVEIVNGSAESRAKTNNSGKNSHTPKPKQGEGTNQNESLTEFKETTPDEIIEILDRFTMIAIIYKRMKDDVKPLDFMLTASVAELQTQLKYFRPLMGKNIIRVTAIDEEFHRKRDIEWGPQSEWGKAQKKHLENIPKNFDSTLVLPSETPKNDVTEPQVKHHATFASVDKEDRLHGTITSVQNTDVKGVDISLFTPTTPPDSNSINEPPSASQSSKNEVVLLIKKTFNVRVAYGLKHRGHHTPTDVKTFVKLLLSIDSNIKILPFQSQNDNTQDHDVITSEEDLPEEQGQLKKWAVDLEVSHNNKLHFGMRMSSTLTFAELRRHLFSWCTKTKSFVKFDNINSTKIFGVGWILGAHPSFHNRNTLKSVLFKDAPDLIEKVTIYPRRVWADSTAKTKRVISNAIVIDGCFFARHRIIQHVCSYKWSGSYHNATFIPFKLSENFTATHRQKAMQEQNVYLRDMWSKTVSVKNSTGLLKCKESGRNFSFITWLQLCEIHGKRILQSVEYIDNERIKILYHKDNEYHVCNMLTHMFPALEKQFGEEKASMLLGDKQEQMQQIKTKSMEHSYADIAAKSVMQRGNPQEDTVNAPPKIKFNSYYGKKTQSSAEIPGEGNRQAKKSTNESRVNTVSRVTPIKSPPPNISNEQRVEMNQMREAIKELKSSHSEQSKTINNLNERLKEAKDNPTNEKINPDSEYSDLQNEIQALWKSQDEKYVELSNTFDTKLETTKTEVLTVVEKNKESISDEISKLKEAQDAATKSIKEQQSVGSMTLLTAIDKLANSLNAKIDAINSNPPISPVEQGSRHGGNK